jgi:hypothetical protein
VIYSWSVEGAVSSLDDIVSGGGMSNEFRFERELDRKGFVLLEGIIVGFTWRVSHQSRSEYLKSQLRVKKGLFRLQFCKVT